MFNTIYFNTAVFNKRTFIVITLPHIILEASYEITALEVNRSFVIGVDCTSSAVLGNAINQAEIDLVGERLEVQHQPAVTNATIVTDVSITVLSKNRLNGKRGTVIILPHCGLELWDVVNVVDAGANQSGSYRVSGYQLEYDVRQGKYQHVADLTAL